MSGLVFSLEKYLAWCARADAEPRKWAFESDGLTVDEMIDKGVDLLGSWMVSAPIEGVSQEAWERVPDKDLCRPQVESYPVEMRESAVCAVLVLQVISDLEITVDEALTALLIATKTVANPDNHV